jgi:hypothetical protein
MSYTNPGEGNPNPNTQFMYGYCQEKFVEEVNKCLAAHKDCRWACSRRSALGRGNTFGVSPIDACMDGCNADYSECVLKAANELLDCVEFRPDGIPR